MRDPLKDVATSAIGKRQRDEGTTRVVEPSFPEADPLESLVEGFEAVLDAAPPSLAGGKDQVVGCRGGGDDGGPSRERRRRKENGEREMNGGLACRRCLRRF